MAENDKILKNFENFFPFFLIFLIFENWEKKTAFDQNWAKNRKFLKIGFLGTHRVKNGAEENARIFRSFRAVFKAVWPILGFLWRKLDF